MCDDGGRGCGNEGVIRLLEAEIGREVGQRIATEHFQKQQRRVEIHKTQKMAARFKYYEKLLKEAKIEPAKDTPPQFWEEVKDMEHNIYWSQLGF